MGSQEPARELLPRQSVCWSEKKEIDWMEHRELWKKVFCDTDKYIDFYFKEKAKKSIVYSKHENNALASMAFFTPYPVMYRGKECICPYIVGVATREESRHKGYMTLLLEQGLMDYKRSGVKLAFLCPADERIYLPFGFQGVYYRRRLEVVGNKEKWFGAVSFSRLEPEIRKKAAEFANAQLYMSDLDLYMCRSTKYYEVLHKEMKALGGKVIVLRDGGFIKAVVSYTHEEDTYEVTEVICDPEDGKEVLQSICAYLGETETRKVIFSDGYFLEKVTGSGICIRQMEKPYIMARALDGEEDLSGLKVYINDIT